MGDLTTDFPPGSRFANIPATRTVDTRIPHRGKKVKKPWGYELIWAHTDRYVGKILHVHQGESLSYQYHKVKDETIYLLRGLMELEMGNERGREKRRLGPGACVRITPGTRHRMTAVEDCDIVEVSTPELDDVVRLEDRYGRAGTKRDQRIKE